MAALRLFLLTIFFPLLVIAMVWRRPRRPSGAWGATLILALGLVGFSFLAAPWGWFGLPARYALPVLLAIAIVLSLRRPVLDETKQESALGSVVKVLLGIFFLGATAGALRGRAVPPNPVALAFPLRGGSFLVEHGGSTGPTNMHHRDAVQRYAVDLVKLNSAWMRARGFYPGDLARYAIYGAEVLSPCDGTVLRATDGLPDALDAKNPFGNHAVLRCGDVDVTLAHLQKGSVAVRPGATIATGQLLGRVGNSGLSAEPHLHVHAQRGETGVPARFDGAWLVRNDVVRK